MNIAAYCQQCGAALSEDLLHGLCPHCVARQAAGILAAPAFPSAVPPQSIPSRDTDAEATVIVTAAQLLGKSATENAISAPDTALHFGGYRIIRLLGKGGMGAVYEAEEIDGGRRVALKVLNHSLDSPETRKRFLREGRLAASINHANSVYIYGTEEIDGTPVIAMELVSGGTLQARVKKQGPLPIREAVDATLQIVAGLEAAAAIGVLHRDVKPANCFVDTDGTAKVGDYGLSISTIARAESSLTVSGAFLGTPAYSSPEQLRGEDLDVRSDIYAVGVTLYYLLTGKTPFAAEHMAQLLAKVLECAPESPVRWRADIPGELAKVVLRCMAKAPSARPRNYGELRQLLSPFSSTASLPATLGLRVLAGGLDWLVLNLATAALVGVLIDRVNSSDSLFVALIMSVAVWLYFAIAEGFWGASIGKSACRLRVIRPEGRSAGVTRAALRALVFPTLIYGIFLFPAALAAPRRVPWLGDAVVTLAGAAIGATFCTLRRKNGFAGLHDLASGTRVVLAPDRGSGTSVRLGEGQPPDVSALIQIGPYHVLRSLGQTDRGELLLGYDARLLRKVWILKRSKGAAALPPARRDLSRQGRLRWLTGKQTAEECWDAFEAVEGQPLLNLLTRRQPWSSVRNWLRDLAEEAGAGINDQASPAVLALNRVWITLEGRAKLLDFVAPGLPIPSSAACEGSLTESVSPIEPPAPTPQDWVSALVFLKQVSLSSLHGCVLSLGEARTHSVGIPLPLHARSFIDNLPYLASAEALAAEMKSLLRKTPAITAERRRLGLCLSFCFLLIACLSLNVMAATALVRAVWFMAGPGLVLSSLVTAALGRGSPLLHILELAVVNRDGSPASRWRCLSRAFITWSPLLIMPLAVPILGLSGALLLLLTVGLAGVVATVWTPQRALQDRVLGTWLVPK